MFTPYDYRNSDWKEICESKRLYLKWTLMIKIWWDRRTNLILLQHREEGSINIWLDQIQVLHCEFRHLMGKGRGFFSLLTQAKLWERFGSPVTLVRKAQLGHKKAIWENINANSSVLIRLICPWGDKNSRALSLERQGIDLTNSQ